MQKKEVGKVEVGKRKGKQSRLISTQLTKRQMKTQTKFVSAKILSHLPMTAYLQ